MTTFSDASDKHAGERPVLLVSFTDGSTTYRWGTQDIYDTTNNHFYDGRIVATSPIDRPVSSAMPPLATFSLTLDNVDSGIDSLFSDYGSFSPVDATITVKRGFESIAVADFQTICVMKFAGSPQITHDRLLVLDFVDDASRHFGEIVSPTAQVVFNAMTTADVGLWPSNPGIPGGDLCVPVVLGHYAMTETIDGVDAAGKHFDHGGELGGYTFPGQCRIVAISKTQFDTADNFLRVVNEDGSSWLYRAGKGSPNTSLTWGQETITLNGATWYLLVYKIVNSLTGIDYREYSPLFNAWRVSVKPYAPDRGAFTHWRVAEFIKGACVAGDGFSAWANQADSDSWDRVNNHTGTTVRQTIFKTTSVADVVSEALKQCSVYAYSTGPGKFAGLWIEPLGGPSPDYSAKVGLTEEDDFLSMDAEIPDDGDFSVANVVTAHYSTREIKIEDAVAGIVKSLTKGVDSGVVFTSDSLTIESATGIARHNARRRTASVGGPLLYLTQDALRLAERELDIRSDPRTVLLADLPWGAAHIDLGDIVRVTHTAIPGWSADRLCVVFGVADDFVAGVVTLTLVDFDAYLSGKVCLYDTMADWVVSDNADEAITINIANASSVITFSANGNWEEALTGDIFEIRTTDNQFQGIITGKNSGAKTLTLASAGGEVGPLPATYTTETAVTMWKVLRSQKTRDTSSTNYAVQDGKYGCYGGQDGFFEDDAEAAYTYQR